MYEGSNIQAEELRCWKPLWRRKYIDKEILEWNLWTCLVGIWLGMPINIRLFFLL
jgi:hypothetical protein